MKKLLVATVFFLLSAASVSQPETLDELPERQELLNGKTLVFEYTNGWGFSLSFYDNMIRYQFRRNITDPESVGARNQDIPYRSRRVGENMYQIMWHESDVKDLVTMLIDFNNDSLYAAGLLGYDEDGYEVFLAAKIQQIIEDQ